MAATKQLLIFGILIIASLAVGYPDSRNPNADYELISGGPQVGPKPNLIPLVTPTKPVVINTPPPVDPHSKTFAYDAKTKTWTLVKQSDPVPADDTLLWNQGNDKFLTRSEQL